MSNEIKINVKCPKCGSESEFIGYRSINCQDDNGLKEKVCDHSLFLHECPECNTKINVEYPFLYHQVDDHIMFHYAITEENSKDVIQMLTDPQDDHQKSIVKSLSSQDYIIRIVRSKAALLEKIAIYDEGLDDRAVEIAKALLAAKFIKDNPDRKIGAIYFMVSADEGRVLQLYSDDKKFTAKAELTPELYQSVVSDFLDKLPPLRADKNLIVNQPWAAGFLKSLDKKALS